MSLKITVTQSNAEQVVVPEGIHLEFLPPYPPELQPAEHLWQLSDEPLVLLYYPDSYDLPIPDG